MAMVELDYVELGVAWQQSTLPELSPLFTWRNHATVPDDSERAQRAAEESLRARGLIRRNGALDDRLYDALAVFAQTASSEADLRFASQSGVEVRAAVAARGEFAVLAVIDQDRVRLETVWASSALASLVNVLPPVGPARGRAVNIASADLDAAVREAAERGDGSDAAVQARLRARGVSSDDARGLTGLVGGDRLLFGKFGVAVRDRTGRRQRGGRAVQVVDTAAGRAALYQRGAHLVAAPADQNLLVRVIGEMLDAAWKQV